MEKDVIRELRKALGSLPEGMTDEEVLKKTKSTLLRFSCQFRDFVREVLRSIGLKPNF
jgi:hypothetical protein